MPEEKWIFLKFDSFFEKQRKIIYNPFYLKKGGFFWKSGWFFENNEKLFIIYPVWGGMDFIENLVDFLKNEEKSFIIHLA